MSTYRIEAAEIGKEAAKRAVRSGIKRAGTAVGWPALLGAAAVPLICGFLALAIALFIAGGGNAEDSSWGGEISAIGANEIPARYLPIYQSAQRKYGVPWNLLAAIHRVETHFSTLGTMVSPVGAVGPMQFMPETWKQYGVDGDGDGKADPFNLADAVFSAANYLAANGAANGRIRQAVYLYNHADWYVAEVLAYADSYVKSSIAVSGTGKTGVAVADVGLKWIGHSTYIFGAGRNQADIAAGRFDCSSFVHWAFAQAGISLGPLGSTSTETLSRLGTQVTLNNIKPGDLVFFNTYIPNGHVGIYVGNGKFIGAQQSTGVAVADMSQGYWKARYSCARRIY